MRDFLSVSFNSLSFIRESSFLPPSPLKTAKNTCLIIWLTLLSRTHANFFVLSKTGKEHSQQVRYNQRSFGRLVQQLSLLLSASFCIVHLNKLSKSSQTSNQSTSATFNCAWLLIYLLADKYEPLSTVSKHSLPLSTPSQLNKSPRNVFLYTAFFTLDILSLSPLLTTPFHFTRTMFKVFALLLILGLAALAQSRALQNSDGVGPLEPGQTTFVNQGSSDVPEPSNRPHFSGGNQPNSDVPEPSTRPHFSGGQQNSHHHHHNRQPQVLEPGQTQFKKQHKKHSNN